MSTVESQLPSELMQHLRDVLVHLSENPYPHVPNPPGLSKRASVALIVRVQPHYAHWPPKQPRAGQRDAESVADRLNSFWSEDWVRHGDPEVLFIKRAPRKGDRWQSHVALPGGRQDPDDRDDRATALRETQEEVGIDLTDENSISVGNLPQRVVTTSWGKVPLMVLCPYIYLLTQHDPPALRLQPTEIASAHWVSLRALLSPSQRTAEREDISNRLAKQEMGLRRWFLRVSLGRMLFSAIRLVPSQSIYCTSVPGFIPEQTQEAGVTSLNSMKQTSVGWWHGNHLAPMAPGQPLLLWGLTLGIVSDFMDFLPPHNAIRLWVYPSFTPWDVRFTLWALSYNFRKRMYREVASGHEAAPAADASTVGQSSTLVAPEERPGEVGIGGLGVGRHYGSIRKGQECRSSAVGLMLEGYYDIVRRAVAVALVGRVSVAVAVGVAVWRRYRRP